MEEEEVLRCNRKPKPWAWESKVFINNKKVNIKLDSGADVTVLSEKLYESEFHMWPILPTNKVLIGPCKTKILSVGKMNATIKTKSGIVTEKVFIVPNLEKPLLSRKAGVALKLIQKVNEINKVNKINEVNEVTEKVTTSAEFKQRIVREYPKLFIGSGEIPGEYQIKLIENPKPFALHVARKVPLPFLKTTKDEIEVMLQTRVISRANEPTPWCSPMMVTPKPNGDVRIRVDLTKLNQNIRWEAHPLPSVDFTLGKLAEAKLFSKIDCNSAFWQRKLSEDSRLLATFITPFGRFCFNRLPYGISTGTEQFQKVMTDLLGRYRWS